MWEAAFLWPRLYKGNRIWRKWGSLHLFHLNHVAESCIIRLMSFSRLSDMMSIGMGNAVTWQCLRK